MRLTETVKQWLTEMEWEDEPDLNEENQTSSTGFVYGIEDFSLNCFVDVAEKSGLVKVYMYYREPNTPEKRADEVQKFCTEVTNRLVVGALLFNRERREILYYAGMDFENATFEPAHLTNLLNFGISTMTTYLPKYMAVCFGGKIADEALEMED